MLYKKVPYDPIRDFAPVTQIAAMPNLLVTHPALPVRNTQARSRRSTTPEPRLAAASTRGGVRPAPLPFSAFAAEYAYVLSDLRREASHRVGHDLLSLRSFADRE